MPEETHKENNKRCHYIFFAPTVGNIGGGQLYVSAKVAWLESIGWEVSVYYTDNQPIYLPNLKKFESYFRKDLLFRFSSYSKEEKRRISTELLRGYDSNDCVVVESYSPETALWGEYMAEMVSGKHICYIIAEKKIRLTTSQRKFFEFKLGQKMLYGITKTSIPSMVPGADEESTFLRAEGCSQYNAPYLTDVRLDMIPKDGFTILSVGRLEKPYMEDLFRQVFEFSERLSVPVNFVVVGDTSQMGVKESLFSIVSKCANVRLLFWGYTFPVPRQLYERADVFVGCAGSANIAWKERVPTITIDAHDYMGIGLLGETTQNRLYRNDSEPPVAVKDLLMVVYEESADRNEKRKSLVPIVEIADFSRHLEIIKIPHDGRYYNVGKVRNALWFDLTYKLFSLMLGKELFAKIRRMKHGIIHMKRN